MAGGISFKDLSNMLKKSEKNKTMMMYWSYLKIKEISSLTEEEKSIIPRGLADITMLESTGTQLTKEKLQISKGNILRCTLQKTTNKKINFNFRFPNISKGISQEQSKTRYYVELSIERDSTLAFSRNMVKEKPTSSMQHETDDP